MSSIFEAEERHFIKHNEAEPKIHHAYKKQKSVMVVLIAMCNAWVNIWISNQNIHLSDLFKRFKRVSF